MGPMMIDVSLWHGVYCGGWVTIKKGPREYLLDVAVESEFGVFFFNNSPKWNAFSMSKSRWYQS
jgi:hypothetical protein